MELTHGNNYNRIEVLAPAGSLEICKAVINAGADAVYLGGDMFGARAYAGNLNNEEMLEASVQTFNLEYKLMSKLCT